MPWSVVAAIGGALIRKRGSSRAADKVSAGADRAAQLSFDAAKMTIDEKKRQFDAMMARSQPQVDAGNRARDKMEEYLYGPQPSKYAKSRSSGSRFQSQRSQSPQENNPRIFNSRFGGLRSRFGGFDGDTRSRGGGAMRNDDMRLRRTRLRMK